MYRVGLICSGSYCHIIFWFHSLYFYCKSFSSVDLKLFFIVLKSFRFNRE
jgi:hypothetical protein